GGVRIRVLSRHEPRPCAPARHGPVEALRVIPPGIDRASLLDRSQPKPGPRARASGRIRRVHGGNGALTSPDRLLLLLRGRLARPVRTGHPPVAPPGRLDTAR